MQDLGYANVEVHQSTTISKVLNMAQNQLVNRIDTFESTGSGINAEFVDDVDQDDNQDDDEFRVTKSTLGGGCCATT